MINFRAERSTLRLSLLPFMAGLLMASALPDLAEAVPHAKPRTATHAKAVPQGTPLRYFRVNDTGQCTVYMNYSYRDDPKFQLRAVDEGSLNAADRQFIAAFNTAFADLMHRRGDACDYNGNPALRGKPEAEILEGCLAQERVMGYAETGWQGGRLPAVSNCISYRDSFPGVISLIEGSLPTPKTTIEAWMAKAYSGR